MLMKKDMCRSFLQKIEMELINPVLKPIQPSHNERNTESSDNDEDSEDDDCVTKHSDYHRTTPYQEQDDDEDNEEEEDSAEVKEETNKYGYSHESDSESSSSSNLFEVSDDMDTNESEANSDEYGSGVNDEDNPSFATKKRVMDDESSSDQSTDGKTKDKLSVQVNRSKGPVATPNNDDSSVATVDSSNGSFSMGKDPQSKTSRSTNTNIDDVREDGIERNVATNSTKSVFVATKQNTPTENSTVSTKLGNDPDSKFLVDINSDINDLRVDGGELTVATTNDGIVSVKQAIKSASMSSRDGAQGIFNVRESAKKLTVATKGGCDSAPPFSTNVVKDSDNTGDDGKSKKLSVATKEGNVSDNKANESAPPSSTNVVKDSDNTGEDGKKKKLSVATQEGSVSDNKANESLTDVVKDIDCLGEDGKKKKQAVATKEGITDKNTKESAPMSSPDVAQKIVSTTANNRLLSTPRKSKLNLGQRLKNRRINRSKEKTGKRPEELPIPSKEEIIKESKVGKKGGIIPVPTKESSKEVDKKSVTFTVRRKESSKISSNEQLIDSSNTSFKKKIMKATNKANPKGKDCSSKAHEPNTLMNSFRVQEQQSIGRRKVSQAHSSISTLGTIINPSGTNQCYSIAAYQLLLGMRELWHDIRSYGAQDQQTIEEFSVQKPFTISCLIMGGLLRTAVEKKAPTKPCKFDIMQSCRMKFLKDRFSVSKQEDACEYLESLLDKILVENPTLIGNNFVIDQCCKRVCQNCNYQFKIDQHVLPLLHIPIGEKFWKEITSQSTCSLQQLVDNAYNSTAIIENGVKCPKCVEVNDVKVSEELTLKNPSNDIILVLKRANYMKNDEIITEIRVECSNSIDIPHWTETESSFQSQDEDTPKMSTKYYLRSVVCHHGPNYKTGHYNTLILENNDDKKTYHEVNDSNHFVLSEERFFDTISSHGYIFHFSKRKSGNLTDNNYSRFLRSKDLNKLTRSCLQKWRKKSDRQTSNKQKSKRKSDSSFVVESSKKMNSRSLPTSKNYLMKDFLQEIKENFCIGSDQLMCQNWNTTCSKCTKRFPTEKKSEHICEIKQSLQIKENGLFSTREIEKDEYICRYIGTVVPRGTTGEYVVEVDSKLTIDGSKTQCLAKYANHSCQPNCVLQKVSRDDATKKVLPFGTTEYSAEVWIKANCQIPKNEELTFHYGTSFIFFDTCLCLTCIEKK
jgi:hypothetical protein